MNILKLTDEDIDKLINNFLDEWRLDKVNKRTPKWTEEMKEIRRLAILRMIRRGLSASRIKEEIQSRWGICHVTAHSYYYDCLDALAKIELKKTAPQTKSELQERIYSVFEKATNNGNLAAALHAADLLAKINGQYVTKQEIDLSAQADIHFNFGGE